MTGEEIQRSKEKIQLSNLANPAATYYWELLSYKTKNRFKITIYIGPTSLLKTSFDFLKNTYTIAELGVTLFSICDQSTHLLL